MRVLFLYPNLHGMNMLPTAVALLSALLKRQGHEVCLFDSTDWEIPGERDFDSDKSKELLLTARPYDDSKLQDLRQDGDVFEAFNTAIESFRPGLIAVSLCEDLFPVAKELLRAVQARHIPTIMGGVFPSFAPELCLRESTVDMVCIGEGEDVLSEVCRRLDAGESCRGIPGLCLKTPDGIERTPLAPPVDIDRNPLLDLTIFPESRFLRPMQGRLWRMLPVETHRGCPFNCAYCNSPAQRELYRQQTGEAHFRKKSFEAIRQELVFFKNHWKAEAFYFWADTFLSYTDREFEQFLEVYQDIRLPFWCQSRPETVKKERLKRLMDVGLFRMSFGVEHGNEDFRKNVLRRKASNKTMLEAFDIVNGLGLKFSVNNIIGFPTETRELAMDTIHFNRRFQCDNANAYAFSPFHGSPLRTLSEQLNYCDKDLIARSVTKPTMLNMPQFPPDQIEGLRRCFTLYVKMPLSMWPEIRKAEAATPEGNAQWEKLRQECLDNYCNFT